MSNAPEKPTPQQVEMWLQLSAEARKQWSPLQMSPPEQKPITNTPSITQRAESFYEKKALQDLNGDSGDTKNTIIGPILASAKAIKHIAPQMSMNVKTLRRILLVLGVIAVFLTVMALFNPNFIGVHEVSGHFSRSHSVWSESHGALEGTAGGFAAASAAFFLAATWTLRLKDDQQL